MTLRIGLVGAGANTKARHIPGLRACADVDIVAVCNRRPESTAQVASAYGIPRTFARWEDLVADPDIDAVVIGTWPYLHAPITLAALAAGKHVLTEARLAMNAAEARHLLAAARRHPHLVVQVVPSPFGLKADPVVRELLAAGFLGDLREVSLIHRTAALADPQAPLHWRQDERLSGVNMLTLGIVHETLLRWLPQPRRVFAQTHAFTPARRDETGRLRAVGSPDSVQVLTELPGGARAIYQFSGATPFGQEGTITLYGTAGVLRLDFLREQLFAAGQAHGQAPGQLDAATEVAIPPERAGGWRVEADFVDSIRTGAPVRFTDLATGVAYMEFTEAVAISARLGCAVPLVEPT